MWCAAGAWCAPYAISSTTLGALGYPGDALLCPTASSWASSCSGVATGPIGNDPMYGAQSWVYDLINVQSVWSMGYTGQGVQIAINDDGIDLTLPDFGGASKFDAAGSCIGAQTCLGGGTSFQGINCVSGTKSDGSAYGSHGTACAAIALGNANSDCSVGIAPGAKLAGVHDNAPSRHSHLVALTRCALKCFTGCPMLAGVSSVSSAFDQISGITNFPSSAIFDSWALTYAIDRNDISSNSWGADPCSALNRRRRQRRLQSSATCPFAPNASPCASSDCPNDWTATPSAACEAVIHSYCTDSSNFHMSASIDPECHNWWHLHMTCSYTDLTDDQIRSLQYAVTHGRQGKGTIYVISSGNENGSGEDVNYEKFLFTRYTIAVGAVGKLGEHSYYSTAGTALLVTAPGGDSEFSRNHVVAQPTQGGSSNLCADASIGTSYAAPVVSGVIALMLEANPALTWHDVQGVLATTSTKTDPTHASWVTNGAGLHHSRKYGFGLVDAHAAVTAALTWTPYGPVEQRLAIIMHQVALVPQDGSTLSLSQSFEAAYGSQISPLFTIEHVYVYLDLEHSARGDLAIDLISPSGTTSPLIPGPRPEATSSADTRNTLTCSASSDPCPYANDGECDYVLCGCDYNDCGGEAMPYDFGPPVWNWKMATVRLWGESPRGTWTLRITDRRTANTHATATLNRWAIYVYGHYAPPPPPSSPPPAHVHYPHRHYPHSHYPHSHSPAASGHSHSPAAGGDSPPPPTNASTDAAQRSAAGGLFGLSLPITIAIFAGAAVAVALLILVVVLVCYCCYCTGGDRGPRRTPTTRATPAQVKRNAPNDHGLQMTRHI